MASIATRDWGCLTYRERVQVHRQIQDELARQRMSQTQKIFLNRPKFPASLFYLVSVFWAAHGTQEIQLARAFCLGLVAVRMIV